MRSNGLLTSLTASLILAAMPASAVVLADYKFQSGDPVSADDSSSDGDLNTTALDVTYGPGAFSNTLVVAGDRAAVISVANANQFLSISQSEGDFISFEITGSNFQIASITFDYALTQAGNDNDYTYHVLSSKDGFTNAIVDGGTGTITGDISGGPKSTIADVNGAELGTIASSITFRIYVTDDLNSGGFHVIDNIVVNGVPEPGSLALLGLGGVFLLWHRRRA